MRFVVLSVFVGLVGCDLNEGPAEETREAQEAIQDGDRPGEIRDQLDDIGQKRGTVVVDPELDRDLREAEQWAERQRKSIDDGTAKVDEDFDHAVNEIQRDLKKLRADVDRLGEKAEEERESLRTSLREQLRELSLKIDKLDGEVDDRPGKDPIGPG